MRVLASRCSGAGIIVRASVSLILDQPTRATRVRITCLALVCVAANSRVSPWLRVYPVNLACTRLMENSDTSHLVGSVKQVITGGTCVVRDTFCPGGFGFV